MVFKRPGNGRNERSGNSSNRGNSSNNGPKRSTSSRGKSENSSDRPNKNQSSFSGERTGSRRPSSAAGSKPYSGRPTGSSDERPARKSFSRGPANEGGEKRPYSSPRSRPAGDGERPVRKSFSKGPGSEGGEKRPYSSPRSKPYTGRPTSGDDRPARKSFSRGPGSEGGEKRPYSPQRSRPYSGRHAADENKPKREYNSRDDREGGENRPKREFSSPRGDREGGERKTGNSRPAGSRTPRPTGDRKFTGKRDGDYKAKPFRKERDTNSEFRERPEAPAKSMRGRKEKAGKDDHLIRLNRYIANAGICSRRKADELIEAGVVSVNGNVISELGFKVDPTKDEIRYNGELLKREKNVYVLLNKPKDYITTTDDPQERRTVMHLVEKASRERIYPIGRLDRNTTGLLLMTNDGDLAEKLSHPRSNVTKLYQVELSKSLTQGDLNKISFGVELEDGLIKPDAVSYVQGGTKREVGIQIHSGKNRIVRRIFEHLGYEVVKLDRVVYANLTKKDLPRGRWRYLDEKEVIQLKHLI